MRPANSSDFLEGLSSITFYPCYCGAAEKLCQREYVESIVGGILVQGLLQFQNYCEREDHLLVSCPVTSSEDVAGSTVDVSICADPKLTLPLQASGEIVKSGLAIHGNTSNACKAYAYLHLLPAEGLLLHARQ